MRIAWMLVALLGCSAAPTNKEVSVSISDTVASAAKERDEARQIQALLAEGWANEKAETARWIGLYADAQLEAQMLRDKFRRSEERERACELEMAALRATIGNLQHRLDQPLVMPTPEEMGIGLGAVEDRYP